MILANACLEFRWLPNWFQTTGGSVCTFSGRRHPQWPSSQGKKSVASVALSCVFASSDHAVLTHPCPFAWLRLDWMTGWSPFQWEDSVIHGTDSVSIWKTCGYGRTAVCSERTQQDWDHMWGLRSQFRKIQEPVANISVFWISNCGLRFKFSFKMKS